MCDGKRRFVWFGWGQDGGCSSAFEWVLSDGRSELEEEEEGGREKKKPARPRSVRRSSNTSLTPPPMITFTNHCSSPSPTPWKPDYPPPRTCNSPSPSIVSHFTSNGKGNGEEKGGGLTFFFKPWHCCQGRMPRQGESTSLLVVHRGTGSEIRCQFGKWVCETRSDSSSHRE